MLGLRILLLVTVAAVIVSCTRDERFFPILGFGFGPTVRLTSTTCTANNLNGTCVARRSCSSGGVAAGTCAKGLGVCCVVVLSCGTTTNTNTTYFTNSNFPSTYTGGGRCTITVTKCAGVNQVGNPSYAPAYCAAYSAFGRLFLNSLLQLRLDFLDLTLAQPDSNGFCRTDFLSVTGGSYPIPRICGLNTGGHVYVDIPQGTSSVVISIDTDSSVRFLRSWNIRISQIEATNLGRAPSGCLQYYDDVTGTVSSFNYGTNPNPNSGLTPFGTREMANLNYLVCVRPAAGYCSIEWSQDTDDVYSFTVSGDTAGLDTTVLATSDAALNGTDCSGDFVIIPNAMQNMVFVNSDRFCGNGFVTTTSIIRPFFLGVVTNDTETPTLPLLPDIANRGFSLSFRQLPCPIF